MGDKRKQTVDAIFDDILSRAGFPHAEMKECLGRAYDIGERRGIERARESLDFLGVGGWYYPGDAEQAIDDLLTATQDDKGAR